MNIKVIRVYGKEKKLGTWSAIFTSSRTAALWITNISILPVKAHMVVINGRSYHIPDILLAEEIEKHIDYCIDIDRSFYN